MTDSVTWPPLGRLIWRWLYARRQPKLTPRQRRLRRIRELYDHLRDCDRRIEALRIAKGRSIAELDDLIYAEEGEWVTCERGHRICRFRRTVRFKDAFDPEGALTDWTQPKPAVGEKLPLTCETCGAPWAKKHPPNPHAHHFEEGGWR